MKRLWRFGAPIAAILIASAAMAQSYRVPFRPRSNLPARSRINAKNIRVRSKLKQKKLRSQDFA